MSSPLVFVRDGRTLPFIPVTLAAMTAIREHTPKRRPYAVTTYMALLEFANEDRTDRVAITQRDLVERVGASRSTVQGALGDLQSAGVLAVIERAHGNARIENEYVIVEPQGKGALSGTPARVTGDPRPSHGQLVDAVQEERQEMVCDGARGIERLHTFSGAQVPAEIGHDAERALAYYAERTGQDVKPRDGRGRTSESMKRILGAMIAHPSLRTNFCRVIDCTLRSEWWGDGPPSVGVIFGKNVVDREIARATAPPRIGQTRHRHEHDKHNGAGDGDAAILREMRLEMGAGR